MNRLHQLLLAGLCLGFHAAAPAQNNTGARQSVTLQDPSRPALVKVNLVNGNLRVKACEGHSILVEARSPRGEPGTSAGSGGPGAPGIQGLKVVEQDNLVSVTVGPAAGAVDLLVQVPVKSSLKLNCLEAGEIEVEKVEGEIEASGLNGSVSLVDVSGVVVAHSVNGQVKARFQQVAPDKPMSFSTLNGDIDVTLPADLKANVKIETLNGSIRSDFEIQPKRGNRQGAPGQTGSAASPPVWTNEKVRSGTINGGGPEFRFKALNGTIHLHKKTN